MQLCRKIRVSLSDIESSCYPFIHSLSPQFIMPKASGVTIACRFRPSPIPSRGKNSVLPHIKSSGEHVFQILGGKIVEIGDKKVKTQAYKFHLDMIFDDQTSQSTMFHNLGEPIIRDLLMGYNSTIFVYGQTGSGKTHSLFGDMSEFEAEQRGIIPRCCQYLFETLEASQDLHEVTIKCSFVEIYKEKLQDLLMPDSGTQMKIRQKPRCKTVYVQGAHEEYVNSFEEIYELLQIGFRNRVVVSTMMNQESSRSHAVLILKIKQTFKGGTVKESKVNFADLAGSEKVKKSGASGAQLEEAKCINKSLSALGNVINALTSKKKKHIPYRDSTLTRMLQSALGGNAKTTLLVTCSSHVYNYEETVSTLRFAKRTKSMKNKVMIFKQMSPNEMQILIAQLKQELGETHLVIAKLYEYLELMRSDKFKEKKHGPQIDHYLKKFAKSKLAKAIKNDHHRSTVQEIRAGKKLLKDGKLTISAEHDDSDDETLSILGTADHTDETLNVMGWESRSSYLEQQRVSFAMEEQMEQFHAELSSKDVHIEELEEEIRNLKREAFVREQQERQERDKQYRLLMLKLHAIASTEGSNSGKNGKNANKELVDSNQKLVDSIKMLMNNQNNESNDDNGNNGKSDCKQHVLRIKQLEADNTELERQMADMKRAYIAHLGGVPLTGEEQGDDVVVGFDADGEEVKYERTGNLLRKYKLGLKSGPAIHKPKAKNTILKTGHAERRGTHNVVGGNDSGMKSMMMYLSGVLLRYFHQVAVLRGPLWICTRKKAVRDCVACKIKKIDFKKVYAVLTRTKLLGYKALPVEEVETKSPIFHYNLDDLVSVTRIEDTLSAKKKKESGGETPMYALFVVTMMDHQVVFRAEGNLPREVWMDHLEELA